MMTATKHPVTAMNDDKKQLWRTILNFVISFLTALVTALTTQSCIRA